MWIPTRFQSLISTAKRRRPIRRCRSASRIHLELLEDRKLMAFNVLAEYATGSGPADITLAQINPGSQLDLIVVNNGNSTVGVRLGNADGTFGSLLTSTTGSSPRSVATGDLTGDGVTDLVTANGGDASLLVGNGDGTFQGAKSFPLPGQVPPDYTGPAPLPQVPLSVAVGDLNADGKLDLVVTAHITFSVLTGSGYYGNYYENHTGSYANVLLGNGTGGFEPAVVHQLAVNRIPNAVAIADFDHDGDADVITANSVELSVLLGDGAGGLGTPIHSGSGSGLSAISLGGLDGDDILDAVTGNGDTLTVQKGQGDGRFVPIATVNMGQTVDSAVVGDVNADGKLDLVAVGNMFNCTSAGYYGCYDGLYTRQSSVLLGNGQGGFSLPITASLGTEGAYFRFADLALADLTGDGLPELATSESYTSVALIARNDGNWIAPVAVSISHATVVEGNSGTTNAVITVTLAADHAGVVSVDFSTADGSAVAGSDYLAKSGRLSFGPGVISQAITVPVYGDRLGEGDETFAVNLSDPTGALIRNGQAVVSILDNEPSISIDHPYSTDPLTVIEGDVGTTPAVFTVALSTTYDQEVTVDYGTSTGHTTDIISAAGTLRFAPGEKSKTITVQVVGDLLDEELEAFNVDLDRVSPNASIANGAAYCYIEDNDPTPPSISISDASVVEGNSGTRLMTFTVGLSQASDQGVWVNYNTANGTASTSNNDYVAKSGTVYIAPGETTKAIAVTIKGDTRKEKDERFFVNLSSANNGVIVDGQGVGAIVNDDGTTHGKAKRLVAAFARAVERAIEDLMNGRMKRRGR